MNFLTEASNSVVSAYNTAVAGLDFQPIADVVISAFTTAMPIVIILIGLRKGVSTLKGLIVGA